jgi:hypothetical protein
MAHRFFSRRSLTACLLLLAGSAYAQGFEGTKPTTGEPMRWEFLIVVLGILFILFKFFGVRKKEKEEAPEPDAPPPPPPPPPPMPKAKPLMVQVAEALGEDLKEVGKNVHMGSKRMTPPGDTETYLMMAKLDKSYIRKEERAIAEARYAEYEEQIQRLKYIIYGMALAIFLLLRDFFIEAYLFLSTYIGAWLE